MQLYVHPKIPRLISTTITYLAVEWLPENKGDRSSRSRGNNSQVGPHIVAFLRRCLHFKHYGVRRLVGDLNLADQLGGVFIALLRAENDGVWWVN